MVSNLEKLVLGAVTLVSLSGCRDLPYGDTGSEAYVVLSPSNPGTEDDLHCRVEGYEDTVFDFYWMKDGATYKTSTGTSSKLSDSYTSVGDFIGCSVWVPESAWYDSYEIGSNEVYIE